MDTLAGAWGGAMHPLISILLSRPQSFNLFQAISLIERAFPHKKGVSNGLGIDEAVRLKADVGLNFQPSDIHSITENVDPGPALTLVSSVMSLAGSGGPLPIPFTELLLVQRKARDESGLAFLDMFNQRVLGQLYSARKKHHLSLQGSNWKRAALVKAVKAVSGVGSHQVSRNWLGHSSLHGPAPRSVCGLVTIVADRLKLNCRAKSFVGDWVEYGLNPPPYVGGKRHKALRLGVNTDLGTRVWCQDKAIELTATTHSLAQYESFIPGGDAFNDLNELVDDYFQSDITVIFSPSPPRRVTASLSGSQGLGRSQARLGFTSWLASSADSDAHMPIESLAYPRLRLGMSSNSGVSTRGL